MSITRAGLRRLRSPFPPPEQLLGEYTQAQWPPLGPYRTAVALLKDTNNGCEWLMEYDDLANITKPWKPYEGDTPASGTAYVNVNGGVTGGYQDAGVSFIFPVAGDWLVDLIVGGYSSGNGQQFIGALGTTVAGHDIVNLAAPNGAFGAVSLNNAFTATKGQVAHFTYQNTGAPAQTGPIVAHFRPVSLYNA